MRLKPHDCAVNLRGHDWDRRQSAIHLPEGQSGNDGCVSVWSAHYPWDNPAGVWDAPTKWYAETIPFDHMTMMNMRIPDARLNDTLSPDLQPLYREIMDRIIQVQRGQ